MDAVRITKPEQLTPELITFAVEALATCPFTSDPKLALWEVVQDIHSPNVALIFAVDKVPLGLTILNNNTGAFMQGIACSHIYAAKPKALPTLVREIRAFCLERKAKKLWGVDVNKRPKAYERLFRQWQPQPEGVCYSYEVK